MGGGNDEKKEVFRAVKGDVRLIKCEVCKEITKVAFNKGKELREEKKNKLLEVDVIEEMESMCAENDDKTLWAVQNDLVVNFRNKLTLKHMGKDVYSTCEQTCKTLLKACEEIMEGKDTDLAEVLFKDRVKAEKQLENWFCKEETEVCVGKPKSVLKNRKPTPEFKKKEKKDIDSERMMGKLKNMPGMPGMQMFNRDQMMNGMGGGDDYDEDYDASDAGAGDYGPDQGEESAENIDADATEAENNEQDDSKAKDEKRFASSVFGKVRDLWSKKAEL